jgi:sulfite exporter TauE/SafE
MRDTKDLLYMLVGSAVGVVCLKIIAVKLELDILSGGMSTIVGATFLAVGFGYLLRGGVKRLEDLKK